MRLHIGHHFFGTGNIGDDFMLAGFLSACADAGGAAFTCTTAGDVDSQRRRFPQVRWLPYEMEPRERMVAECDAWVGVGGTPFQLSVGPWFLEHLAGEARMCRDRHKPMFFIGVGVSEPESLQDPRAREVLAQASRVWARDPASADHLAAAGAGAKVVAGADLAHAWLAAHPFPPPEEGVTAYVLNFEDPRQFRPAALDALVRGGPASHRWLFQEVRRLSGSEAENYDALAPDVRAALDVRRPDYASATTAELLSAWGVPRRVLTSRYHGALAAAWMGSSLVVVERSAKLSGAVAELGVVGVKAADDEAILRDALGRAAPVGRGLLQTLASRAAAACAELLAAV